MVGLAKTGNVKFQTRVEKKVTGTFEVPVGNGMFYGSSSLMGKMTQVNSKAPFKIEHGSPSFKTTDGRLVGHESRRLVIRSLHTGSRRRHGGHEGTPSDGTKLDELAAKVERNRGRKKYVAKKIKVGTYSFVLFVCDARRIFFLVVQFFK